MHEVQRHADDVADAEGDGAHVHVGEPAVEQVGDHARACRCGRPLPGIFRLVANVLSVSVCLVAAARELELERRHRSSASMMNARSAPEISIAASSTSASTSCSTRPEPSARKPSSSAVIWRRSSRAPVVDRPVRLRSSSAAEEHEVRAAAAARGACDRRNAARTPSPARR